MLYTFPDYYRQFQCKADQCEDTCCAGWQISIDQKSLARYKRVKGNFKKRLRRSIHWFRGTFKQKQGKRCAFLNEQNLCDMYSALGKESLCKTCRLYPRHIEEFEGVREVSLSVSCPEAAWILLQRKEPVRFLTYEKPGEEEYEEFDPFLYSKLVDGRETMLKILQNRELEIEVRAGLVVGLAHDMQRRIQKRELFSCDEVFVRYQTEAARKFVEQKIQEYQSDYQKRYLFAKRTFSGLFHLEVLRDDWDMHLQESVDILYENGPAKYECIETEFSGWMKEHMPQWPIQCEQLLVYFLFTYFCGAVYDGRAYAKVQMSVVSVLLIYEMLAARWMKNEKYLDFEDIIEIVYRYSREVEHSDQNLEEMEKLMEERGIDQWKEKRPSISY